MLNESYGLNTASFMRGDCSLYDPQVMYADIFRLIGLYPRIIFYLLLASVVLLLSLVYLKRPGNWFDKWSDGLITIVFQFVAFSVVLMYPITFVVTGEGLTTAGTWSKYFINGVIVATVLYGLYWAWKNRDKFSGGGLDEGEVQHVTGGKGGDSGALGEHEVGVRAGLDGGDVKGDDHGT